MALVMPALVAYHGLILRRDRASLPAHARRVPVVAYMAPGTQDLLADICRHTGQQIVRAWRLGVSAPFVATVSVQGRSTDSRVVAAGR
jgi:hypothetical protein